MKKTLLAIFPIASSFFMVSAQIIQQTTTGAPNTFGPLAKLISLAQNVLATLVPIAIGFGLVSFLFFLALFIWKGADSPTEQTKAKTGMIWSIVALFVMVSIYGIILVLASILGVSVGGGPQPFKLPGEQ